jgi:hypothetical protein
MRSDQQSRVRRLLAAGAVVFILMAGCQALSPLEVRVSTGSLSTRSDLSYPSLRQQDSLSGQPYPSSEIQYPSLGQPYRSDRQATVQAIGRGMHNHAVDGVQKTTVKGNPSSSPGRRGPATLPRRPVRITHKRKRPPTMLKAATALLPLLTSPSAACS